MSRATRIAGATVVIDVPDHCGHTCRGDEEVRCAADAMLAQVRRHVDSGRSARIEYDVRATCSHCGARWTEDARATWNGGCCDKDAEAWTAAAEALGDALACLGYPTADVAAIREVGELTESDACAAAAFAMSRAHLPAALRNEGPYAGYAAILQDVRRIALVLLRRPT